MSDKQTLQIFCDGGSRGNPGPAAYAFIVKDTWGKIIYREGNFLGVVTNNEAEYYGVLKAWEWLVKNSDKRSDFTVNFFLDSRLIVNQLNGLFKIKKSRLRELILKIKILEVEFKEKVFYNLIPREKNNLADKIVNYVLDNH